MSEHFNGNFTQQEPLSDKAIEAAMRVLQHGRLHRYNEAAGELSETAALEIEFADKMGSRYALAVASGGYAIATALRALGVGPGDQVLTNAFTLAPVPGAIASVGATPVFVEVTPDLTIDLTHLQELLEKPNAPKTLLLSHMRGHICDMDQLLALTTHHNVNVVEDCAHTMGARWNGVLSGRHGVMAAYSTQTYKHVNSGEGGLLISDDPDLMARATILSGSYMLYERHRAGPSAEAFEKIKYLTPNISGRMDNLRAAILRPQLANLDQQCAAWNERYQAVEAVLKDTPGLTLISRPEKEDYVMSSFQFLLLDWSEAAVQDVVRMAFERGVEVKWFGGAEPSGFTSRYDSWRYAPTPSLPQTDRILKAVLDFRLPLTFSLEDCAQIARILRDIISSKWENNQT